MGISDGDFVWVESMVGKVKVKARLFPGHIQRVSIFPMARATKPMADGRKTEGSTQTIFSQENTITWEIRLFYSTRVKVYKA